MKKTLRYRVKRAGKRFREEKGEVSKDHKKLIYEFLSEVKPADTVRELFLRMPDYATRSESCVVLNAFDKEGNLGAFYFVDLAAKEFAAYLIGCYSRERPVPGASDLLFHEMISLAREEGKRYINLGLGVNEGIRRFKKKWGGVPEKRYESCTWDFEYSRAVELIKAWKI